MRHVYFTRSFPPSAADLKAAQSAGATEIVQSPTRGGYVEIAEPGDSVAEQRATALSQLAALRYAKQSVLPYEIDNAPYQLPCDQEAGTNVLGAVVGLQLAQSQGPITWKLSQTQFRPMTLTELVTLGQAMRAHIQACYVREGVLAALIANSDAPLAVDISKGWP